MNLILFTDSTEEYARLLAGRLPNTTARNVRWGGDPSFYESIWFVLVDKSEFFEHSDTDMIRKCVEDRKHLLAGSGKNQYKKTESRIKLIKISRYNEVQEANPWLLPSQIKSLIVDEMEEKCSQ